MGTTTINTSAPPTPPAETQPEPEFYDLSSKMPDSPMADQFPEDAFDCLPAEPEADVEKPHLITHAKVYAIAEK